PHPQPSSLSLQNTLPYFIACPSSAGQAERLPYNGNRRSRLRCASSNQQCDRQIGQGNLKARITTEDELFNRREQDHSCACDCPSDRKSTRLNSSHQLISY